VGWADSIASQLEDRRKPVSSAPKAFDADAIESALSAPSTESRPATWVPDSVVQAPTPETKSPSIIDRVRALPEKIAGSYEAAASLGSGMVAAPVAAAAGVVKTLTGGKYGTQEGAQEGRRYAAELADSLTYRPRTQSGQDYVGAVGKAVDASKIAGLGPSEMTTLAGVSAGPRLPKPVSAPAAQPAPFASVGGAATSPAVQAQAMAAKASPEIQAVVKKARGGVNLPVLERVVEADTLPVPVRLTKGQATQDVGHISHEQNMRGQHEAVRNRFDEQNKALIANTTAIKEAAAPDVYATNNVEHGDSLIHAYRSKDAALSAEISKRYKALTDANGGDFPLDSKAFVNSADAALHKELLFDHVPGELRKTLDRLREGGTMTFENFESLRTNLARIQRSQTADGNAKAAAGTIRQALEDLPMPLGAEHLKPLADAARAAAKERFALIEADPAYKAVVTGKASADKFIDKYVIGADLKHVETLKNNLANDPIATQTVRAGVINRLKSSAGIAEGDVGNFSQAGYNKALEKIRPKLGVLFDPEHKNQLETLGRVARNTQIQPRGSFVNNSNTATTLMAEGAKSAAEGAANVAAGGVPVGTWTRRYGGHFLKQRAVNEALQTGAGIRLKDVGK